MKAIEHMNPCHASQLSAMHTPTLLPRTLPVNRITESLQLWTVTMYQGFVSLAAFGTLDEDWCLSVIGIRLATGKIDQLCRQN